MMKRSREKLEKKTEIKAAIEELSLIIRHPEKNTKPYSVLSATSGDHGGGGAGAAAPAASDSVGDQNRGGRDVSDIPTRPFLAVCSLILQVLDKIGPTMAVLRQDIFQNIQRIDLRLASDPKTYSNVLEIIKKESAEGTAKKTDSCSRALLWLTRSLDFMVALLERIARDQSRNMEQIVEESYMLTLKPWHGWISSAAYKVALKLLPDKTTFIELLVSKGENLSTLCEQVQSLIVLLVPLLDDIHCALVMYGLDRLKCT